MEEVQGGRGGLVLHFELFAEGGHFGGHLDEGGFDAFLPFLLGCEGGCCCGV